MTKALVVGYGSIGKRHAKILRSLGCEVSVVSRRELAGETRFATLNEGLKATGPDYVIIANETASHLDAVRELIAAGFRGRVLIEKPLGGQSEIDASVFEIAGVAYNLRFHPELSALRQELSTERIISIEIYCGQYLPDWRPDTDYRSAYSARRQLGGGVLRDLSHELDYLLWLAGPWRRVAALGGKFSTLEIDTDDSWVALVELERCPLASLQINYLDRPGRRRITVVTDQHTYALDFGGVRSRDGEVGSYLLDHDESYAAQHRAMLASDRSVVCSIAEAQSVMELIAACERASSDKCWVSA